MKVLQLITSTRSFFEQQVEVLESRGVECTVVGVPGEYSADSPRTVTDYLRYYPRVLDHVRRGDYDIVHANYGLAAPFALAQPVRPVVLTLWGTDLMGEMGWLRQLSRTGARLADAVVLPSPVMSTALETEHVEIPFGVDTDQFRPIPREEARTRVGWETDRPVALFPYDSSRAEKDFPRAKRAVDRADVDLELRTVTGVPHEEVPAYMNASDVLLVTSKRESGPMVVKEAAACNLPVVSTDVGFVRETLSGVENCVVCETDDELAAGLESVVADGGRSNGREVVDQLSLDAMGEQLLALYDRVLEDSSGRPTTRRTEAEHGV
ncbi:glycosyltransferase family 4 protein [Halobacteria archaeon AArc-m2/3/4]|uniref:Glycosyltransferase family 4 protein n=1 Tax=Natronoglomus mannanivorans TaxID=2979990 RepID=A0ABT2QGS8_9EURY|nr:glycosyltransferase family 4 protein [Halobacteria archaeon AArc-m2/3/4]